MFGSIFTFGYMIVEAFVWLHIDLCFGYMIVET